MSEEAKMTDSVKRKRIALGLGSTAVVLGGITIAGLLGAFSTPAHTEETLRAGGQVASSAVQGSLPEVLQTSATPQPVAETTTSPSAVKAQEDSGGPKSEVPKSNNCYDNDGAQVLTREKATPEIRREFADLAASTLIAKGITATVGGEGSQFLLFTAAPENADQLSDWEHIFQGDGSAKANVCLKGFAEVQFIVRDASMNQQLLSKVPTDVHQTWSYAVQNYGATPMK